MAERTGMKTFRDAIHGDIRIFPHELIVINTKTYQRLHGIRQLDLAHKVYQDAVHTRFEHLIGATYLADLIWQTLRSRPHMEIWASRFAPDYQAELDRLGREEKLEGFRAVKLPDRLEITRHMVRLATLLHDVTHIPFGHMLENQLALFRPHDTGHRLKWFLSSIVLEILERFTQLRQEADPYYGPRVVYYLLFLLAPTTRVLSELSSFAHTEDTHKHGAENSDGPKLQSSAGLPSEFSWALDQLGKTNGLAPNESFLADMIGNTICADLLDYVRRDNYFTGLWDKYDDRVLRSFSLARVQAKDSGNDQIRLGIQVIKGKLRHDTISNVLRILELRYDLAEKVIFHHARCAASAMLARAFVLSGLDRADEGLFYELGDDGAIRRVEELAVERRDKSGVDAPAVRRLLSSLRGRDLYKPYYRFLKGADEATRSGSVHEPTVGEGLFREFRNRAVPLLHKIEHFAGLPHGTVVLYCPDPKMMLKETATMVCGDSEEEIPEGEPLKEFVAKRMPVRLRQIEALEERYAELWGATFFVHPEYRARSPLLKQITLRLLEDEFGCAPTSDPILDDELAKLPTSQEMEGQIRVLKELEVQVLGGIAGAPSRARSQAPLTPDVLKEDVFTRVSSAIGQEKRTEPQSPEAEGAETTAGSTTPTPSGGVSPDSKPKKAKQLKLEGQKDSNGSS
jgi:HD superfamily phosphohydrolase